MVAEKPLLAPMQVNPRERAGFGDGYSSSPPGGPNLSSSFFSSIFNGERETSEREESEESFRFQFLALRAKDSDPSQNFFLLCFDLFADVFACAP